MEPRVIKCKGTALQIVLTERAEIQKLHPEGKPRQMFNNYCEVYLNSYSHPKITFASSSADTIEAQEMSDALFIAKHILMDAEASKAMTPPRKLSLYLESIQRGGDRDQELEEKYAELDLLRTCTDCNTPMVSGYLHNDDEPVCRCCHHARVSPDEIRELDRQQDLESDEEYFNSPDTPSFFWTQWEG